MSTPACRRPRNPSPRRRNQGPGTGPATLSGADRAELGAPGSLAPVRADVDQGGRHAVQPPEARRASDAQTFSSVPGGPRQGRTITLMEVRLSRVKHRMPARWRASLSAGGAAGLAGARRAVRLLYAGARVATVSAGPVFVVRARLSKIERGAGWGCSCLDRGCSRAGPGACRLFSRRGA